MGFILVLALTAVAFLVMYHLEAKHTKEEEKFLGGDRQPEFPSPSREEPEQTALWANRPASSPQATQEDAEKGASSPGAQGAATEAAGAHLAAPPALQDTGEALPPNTDTPGASSPGHGKPLPLRPHSAALGGTVSKRVPWDTVPGGLPRARLHNLEQCIAGLESSLTALKQEFAALKEEADAHSGAAHAEQQLSLSHALGETAVETLPRDASASPSAQDAAALGAFSPAEAKSAGASLVVGEGEVAGEYAPWQGDAPVQPPAAEKSPHDAFAPALEQGRQRSSLRPEEPSFLERAWAGLSSLGITRFLSASNIWVLAGIGILLMGLVFLVRFAMQFAVFGPEIRLALAALVGLVLLGIGWRHREKQRELGLILQGGGVGALYLTVVAAVKLYDLLPQSMAFALLVGVVVFSSFLAIAQHAKIMAHVSKGAGFLAPVLVSADSGNYIALFSYYILLNLGIIGVSRYRQWRSLHLTGFIFTVAIGGAWGARSYTPDLFPTVEPFLLAFFAIFTYLALTGSKPCASAPQGGKNVYIDAPLTLGTPLIFTLYQAHIAGTIPFALSFSALGLGALYLTIAWRLWHTRDVSGMTFAEVSTGDAAPAGSLLSGGMEGLNARLLREATGTGKALQAEIYLAFGIVFANLTLPLALYDFGLYNWGLRLMGLVWCMEGAALYWLGRKNALRLFRGFGFAGLVIGLAYTLRYLLGGAPVYLAEGWEGGVLPLAALPSILFSLLIHLMGAGAFLFTANAVRVYSSQGEDTARRRLLQTVFTAVGALWLYASFVFELYLTDILWEGTLVLCTLVGIAAVRLGQRLDWKELTLAPFVSYVPLAILAIPLMLSTISVLVMFSGWRQGGDTVAKALVLAHALYTLWSLWSKKKRAVCLWGSVRFALAWNLALPMLMLLSFLPDAPFAWGRLVLLAWPAAFVWGLTRLTVQQTAGSAAGMETVFTGADAAEAKIWLFAAIFPLCSLLLWLGADIFLLGNPAPLPYVPLLNPIDFGCILCLLLCRNWVQTLRPLLPENDIIWLCTRNSVWAGAAFILLNVSIARACAMWTDMPFTLSGVMRNGTCQGIMAIIWAAAGFTAMLRGHTTHRRPLWIAGVFLVLADVGKLFLVDLTRMETIWRIVAFMAVGLLLIVIGYYVPLPPAAEKKAPIKENT